MSKITTMNRDAARLVGDELRAAVADIAAKHGLTVRAAKVVFDPLSGTLRLPVELVTDSSMALDAQLLGLPADIVGRTFTLHGERYLVTGLNPRRPKFCVAAKRCSDGKMMAYPAAVARLLDDNSTPTTAAPVDDTGQCACATCTDPAAAVAADRGDSR